ncbi:MAG: hypothetical protein QXX82_05445 [Nitrososphaerota archaeon]
MGEMVKVDVKENLFVGFHEWVWSLWTQGFPVLAVTYNYEGGRFEIVEIGRTTKAPATHTIPPNTVVIIRKYVSNKRVSNILCI